MENQNPAPNVIRGLNGDPETPPASNIPKPKSKFRLVAYIVIIVSLILIGAEGLYIYRNQGYFPSLFIPKPPTPNYNETQNSTINSLPTPTIQEPNLGYETTLADGSKQYTDKINGFSFEYPATYLLGSLNVKNYIAVEYCPTHLQKDCAYPSNIFQVTIRSNESLLTSEKWFHSFEKDDGLEGCYLNDPRTLKSDTTFENFPAISVAYTFDSISAKGVCEGKILEGGGEAKDYFIFKNDKVYHLSIALASKERLEVLNQILATFKFTDSQTATSPAPTCTPRPACLDSTPRCMIAEPANGWCP